MQKQTNILTVDPGLDGAGWAFWDVLDGPPHASGVIKTGRQKLDWLDRVNKTMMQFESVLNALPWSCQTAYIEFPGLWGGSSKSHAAAVRGDLFKLAFLIGSIYSVLHRNYNYTVIELIKPSDWKGQLNKEQIDKRIFRAIATKYAEHESDAVGIGLHLQGIL